MTTSQLLNHLSEHTNAATRLQCSCITAHQIGASILNAEAPDDWKVNALVEVIVQLRNASEKFESATE